MIVVAGGTGRLGSAVVSRLVDRGESVRVLSRGHVQTTLPPEAEVVRADVRRRDDLDRALAGARVVVSAVQGMVGRDVTPASVDRDGNLALIAAAERSGAAVVLMSVTHAGPDHPMEIGRMKGDAERALAASAVPGTIVRSAGFAELWLDILEQTAGRAGRPVVLGRGQCPIWWVSVEDVADIVTTVTRQPAYRGRTVEVVGPDGLTVAELATRLMASRGWPGRPRRVPRLALRLGAATLGVLKPEVGRLLRASLGMDLLEPEHVAVMRRDFPDHRPTTLDEVLAVSALP